MIWFSDLVEPAENFAPFFSKANHKILDTRNIWLLNIRNMGDSDHHESFAMEEISEDIMRFMDKNKLTMATLGGHGFGAKVALATAINNMDRVTGVINLEGGPLDHRFYEAYQELQSYVEICNNFDIAKSDYNSAVKFVEKSIACTKWRSIFKQNLEDKGSSV
jgi:pimeloyl-ACP methyl ester carboxylesterase